MSAKFTPVGWSYHTSIYEVNIRQYTQEGTFKAFEKELPRLRDMGIEVLWFMPVTPISRQKRLGSLGSYYACSDYTSINPEFGSHEDFRQLVQEAHRLHFKVLIDWVANHTGWDHTWTREHPDYYKRNHEGNFYDPNGWEDVIDLNYDNPDVTRAMIDAMRFWVNEFAIDGFRCDMAMLVPLAFWRSARQELDKTKDLFWMAECEEIHYHEVFDATYSWKLLHTMEAVWKGHTNLRGLEEVLHHYTYNFPPEAFHLFFTTNHDENSHSGSEFERMGSAAKAFAVLCCTWNGIPLIYSGQELPNYKRLRFFDKDGIEWNGTYQLHDFFRRLLLLRKTNSALAAGILSETYRLTSNDDYAVLTYLRKNGNDEVLVILNLSHEEKANYRITDERLAGSFENLFSPGQTDFTNRPDIRLGPWQYMVWERIHNYEANKLDEKTSEIQLII